MYCYLCSQEYVGLLTTNYYCESCLRIKRYVNIHNKRVIQILDSVLSRSVEKQNNKVKLEVINEIEKKKEELDLNDSISLYNNKDKLITELKENLKKSKKTH